MDNRHHVFSNLFTEHDGFVRRFLDDASISCYNKGEYIYHDGQVLDGIYMILDGMVESYYVKNGRRHIISVMCAGAIMGSIGLLSQSRHSSLRCKNDSLVAFVPKEKLLCWDAEMILALLSDQSAKIHMLYNQLSRLTLSGAEHRLLLFLYEIAKENLCLGRMDLPVHISFSNQELASIICVSREYVATMLKTLQKQCRFKTEKNELFYYPCDIEKLLDVHINN